MIHLEPISTNVFVVYVDTITNDVETFGDYFLFGFQNGFTKAWDYVIPVVLTRNTRFVKFQIELCENVDVEDPENGVIYLAPSGNWDYTLYNATKATLNPQFATLIDEGQMVLDENQIPEVQFTSYVSNNENLSTYVFWSSNNVWNTTPNLFNAYQKLWQSA